MGERASQRLRARHAEGERVCVYVKRKKERKRRKGWMSGKKARAKNQIRKEPADSKRLGPLRAGGGPSDGQTDRHRPASCMCPATP